RTSDEAAFNRSLALLRHHLAALGAPQPPYTPYVPMRFEDQARVLLDATYPCSALFTAFRRAKSLTSAGISAWSRLEPQQRLTKLRCFRRLVSTRSWRPASKPVAIGALSCAPLRIP